MHRQHPSGIRDPTGSSKGAQIKKESGSALEIPQPRFRQGEKLNSPSPLHSLITRLQPVWCHPLQQQLGSRWAPTGLLLGNKVSKGWHCWGGEWLNPPRSAGERKARPEDVTSTSAAPGQQRDKHRGGAKPCLTPPSAQIWVQTSFLATKTIGPSF